jgi:hypothetical protein
VKSETDARSARSRCSYLTLADATSRPIFSIADCPFRSSRPIRMTSAPAFCEGYGRLISETAGGSPNNRCFSELRGNFGRRQTRHERTCSRIRLRRRSCVTSGPAGSVDL